jgi:hypothetical protein
LPYLSEIFEQLVELTEPICRKIDAELADELIFDTTGIESHVAENNPKFMSSKLRQAKKIAKSNPNFNPYMGVYSLLPDHAKANSAVKQQYINGHFCYAQKAGMLTNGLGIVRHIALFDEDFKAAHPEMPVEKRTDNPDADKEIADSKALLPVLRDFKAAHPSFAHSTFIGDSSFDSYDLYAALLGGECGFSRAVLPMNPRNSAKAHKSDFNDHGIPLCPADKAPMRFHSVSGGKNRSKRLKFVCPKSEPVKYLPGILRCRCENPCTNSKYGRCVYVYPDANKRLYPGIVRGTPEWEALYARRIKIERSIGSFKSVLGVSGRKTYNTKTTKADLFIAGIAQLLCVVLADKIHKPKLIRSVRKFAA